MDTRAALLTRLHGEGVVPVIRTPSAALAETAVQWLFDGGFSTFELTLTIPGAVDLIRALSDDKELLVGAGTVLDRASAERCIEAGARFLVSPAVSAEIVTPADRSGAACLLGAATPSEVLAARAAGASAVKLFPIASLGGPAHVKALAAVFPDVEFCPTGGISVAAIGDYLLAGASFVGVGGELVDVAALEAGERQRLVDAAHAAQSQVRRARA